MAETTLFAKIVAGEIPAQIVHRDDFVTAFRDINPQAPTHILIVPNESLPGVESLTAAHGPLLIAMFAAARKLAAAEGIAEKGYRLVFNQGQDGGQTVFHLHMHLLGGRHMTWPPG